MGIRSIHSKPFAAYVVAQQKKWMMQAGAVQETWRQNLVRGAQQTAFGRDHGFQDIKTYEDFKAAVPIRDYEGLRPYFDRLLTGESDVLWPGKPLSA